MIILFTLVYYTVKNFFVIFNNFFDETFENDSHNNKFENILNEEIEVIDNKQDLDLILKFDPPVYKQRYSAVKETLIDERWRGKLKKVVDFGCAEFGFFFWLKRVIGVQEIILVDIDKDLLETHKTKLGPLLAEYLNRRKEPLEIKILLGSISNPSLELIGLDAVIGIEM